MNLFEPLVPKDLLHPNFLSLLVPGLSEPARAVITE